MARTNMSAQPLLGRLSHRDQDESGFLSELSLEKYKKLAFQQVSFVRYKHKLASSDSPF